MKPSKALALVVTSMLALGCAAARAQDGPGNPPPGPQPAGSGEARRPPMDERQRAMVEERVAEAQKRVAEAEARVEQVRKEFGEGSGELAAAAEHLAHARMIVDAIRSEAERHRPEGFERAAMERRAAEGGRPGRRADEEMMVRARLEQARGLGYVGGQRPGRMEGMREMGPGPSVEERLTQIERAVHEMREMFERHGVAPEMRERAEREMRERRGDMPPPGGQPGEDPRPRAFGGRGEGQGPSRGEGRSFGGGPGPDRPPEVIERPAIPRPRDIRPDQRTEGGMDEQAMAMRKSLEASRAEMETQMRQAREQMEAMAKQLADTQAALKKAQEELETLRAKK